MDNKEKIINKIQDNELNSMKYFSAAVSLQVILNNALFKNEKYSIKELKKLFSEHCKSKHEILENFGSFYIKFIFDENNDTENLYIRLDNNMDFHNTESITADELKTVLKNRIYRLISDIKKCNTELFKLDKKYLIREVIKNGKKWPH